MAGNRTAYQAHKKHQTEDGPEGSVIVAQHPLAPPEISLGNAVNLKQDSRIVVILQFTSNTSWVISRKGKTEDPGLKSGIYPLPGRDPHYAIPVYGCRSIVHQAGLSTISDEWRLTY
jgi:hypothetical protein